jgi:hypothetical protein
MKRIFTLIAVAAMAFAAQAAELTVCDGTTTGEYAPVYGYNFETDQHNQMQYPAAELTGLAAGTEITAMKFYTSTPDEVNALGGTVTVSLANIDEVTPWSPDAWGGVSGNLLDVEVTAVATLTPAADEDGVWVITFDAPFTYTGNALLVDVQSAAGDYNNTAFYGKEVGSYLVMSTYGYAGSKKSQTLLPKVAFTYEAGEGGETAVDLLSQANALEDNSEFTFNGDAVVTVCWNGYLFLRDESGYGQISGFDGTLVNGQVLNPEWTATKTSDDGWVKYIDAAGISASGETNDALAAAQKLTGAVDESMINAYVYVENVKLGTFPPRSITLPDGSTIAKTEILGGINWSMGGYYNVYGIICKVDGALKFNAVSCEEYVEPEPEVLRGDVNKDKVVNIADVTALIDMLLSGAEMIPEADCNLDNVMNIADVTALIDFLLSGTWPN